MSHRNRLAKKIYGLCHQEHGRRQKNLLRKVNGGKRRRNTPRKKPGTKGEMGTDYITRREAGKQKKGGRRLSLGTVWNSGHGACEKRVEICKTSTSAPANTKKTGRIIAKGANFASGRGVNRGSEVLTFTGKKTV